MAPDDVIAAEAGPTCSARERGSRASAEPGPAGAGPWQLAWRRLRRDKLGLAFGVLFVLLVAACLAAPLWAKHVAHTTPDENHLTDTIEQDGETVNVVSLEGIPIGPTWQGEFFLGADGNGRDNMVRLLYGGRNSLLIGIIAAVITTAARPAGRALLRLLARLVPTAPSRG